MQTIMVNKDYLDSLEKNIGAALQMKKIVIKNLNLMSCPFDVSYNVW